MLQHLHSLHAYKSESNLQNELRNSCTFTFKCLNSFFLAGILMVNIKHLEIWGPKLRHYVHQTLFVKSETINNFTVTWECNVRITLETFHTVASTALIVHLSLTSASQSRSGFGINQSDASTE